MHRAWGAWAAVLFAVVGCGSDEATEQQPIPAGLGLRAAAALCETRVRCCDAQELRGSRVDDDVSCRISAGTWFEGSDLPAIRASAAAGRLTFDVPAFERCIEDARERSCGEDAATRRRRPWDVLRGCVGAIRSHQDLGESCRLDYDCTTRHCRIADGAVDGTCASLPGRDETCLDWVCAPGLYCEPAVERCLPSLADGAACSYSAECDSGFCAGTCAGFCTGGGEGALVDPGPFDDLGAAMVEAECGGAARCCGGDELAQRVSSSPEGDEISCRARQAPLVINYLIARYAAVRADRGTIDSDELATCRSFLRDGRDCAEFSAWTPVYSALVCQRWFNGTISCATSADCGPHAFCVPFINSAGEVDGDCYDGSGGGASLGETCTSEDACDEGTCYGDDPRRGVAGTCALLCGGNP